MAERLGERIHRAGTSNLGSAAEPLKPVVIEGAQPRRDEDPANSRSVQGADSAGPARPRHAGFGPEPKDEEELVAFALADDLVQGAVLFRPLADLLEQKSDVWLREALFG